MSDLTVFKPVTEATDASRTWAASVLADLPVVVKFCETACRNKAVTQVMTDDSGRNFRQAFHIGVKHGARFTIHLYREATRADLQRANQMIARLKNGIVCDRLWEEFTSGEGRYMNSWLPFDPETWSPELRPCTDPNCRRDWHEWEPDDRGDFQVDACQNDAITTDSYSVVLQRDPGEPWVVESWPQEVDFCGPEGLKAVRAWANDFAYLQGECDRLNAVPVKEAA